MKSTTVAPSADFSKLRIIDCDAHFTEPADLWVSRAPSAWKDRVPVQQTRDGITSWYLEDQIFAGIGGNTVGVGHEKFRGTYMVQPFELVDHAAWSVKERLELLDEMGVYAQVLYPNAMGFSSNHIFAIDDPAQRTAILTTFNDFYLDVQEESKGRLFPQGILPIWDMDLTINEMTRLLDKGMTGFTLSDKPELLGLPELPEAYFEPMWDLFNESGAAVNFHIGSGKRREDTERRRAKAAGRELEPEENDGPPTLEPAWNCFPRQRSMATGSVQQIASNIRIIANMCMSDLFDRFPNLNVVSAESGIGWVPFLLEALEYQYDEMLTEPDAINFAKRRPREYFKDHIFVMFWFETSAPRKLLDDIGVNNVLVETDLPHPTCLYPNTAARLAETLAGVDAHAVQRILQDNAAELYHIALP